LGLWAGWGTSTAAVSAEGGLDPLAEKIKAEVMISEKNYQKLPENLKEMDRKSEQDRKPIVPFQSKDVKLLSPQARAKQERLRRNYELAAAIHPEDGWKMKLDAK